jgi:hypothetical protein
MKALREAIHDLHFAVQNATPNVDFAGKVLVQQAEDVVTKARADVEAFVAAKVRQLGVDPQPDPQVADTALRAPRAHGGRDGT